MLNSDDAQKSSVSWSSTHVSMGAPEEQKRRTNQRVPVGYQPKTFRRFSQKRAPTLLESMSLREIMRTLICEGLGVFIVA